MMPPEPMGLNSEAHDSMFSGIGELQDFNLSRENMEPTEPMMSLRQRALFAANANAARRRENAVRSCQIARRSVPQLACFDAEEAEQYAVFFNKKAQKPSVGKKAAEDFEGPFYEAMEMINKRKLVAKKNSTSLIAWVPSTQGHTIRKRIVPSLVDVSVDALAKNSDAMVSLELIPDLLRHKISQAICRGRRMNVHFVELLLRGSPTEIRLDDCSWMTEEQFTKLFRRCKTKNLTVIQLDLCGRCMTHSTLLGTIARSSNCLPALATMSLKGACRLLNEGIGVLVTSAPALQSLHLGQCSLLTHSAINVVADVLGHILKELFIDDCQNINAMFVLPALKRLECLEVLSVAGIQTVSDDFIAEIVTAFGSNMKELVLSNCFKITDDSLKAIGRTCSSLSAIDLSTLDLLTDSALQYLANGCQSIQTLRLCRNNFSDEAIAAFLETSGQSLKHLSLNHSSKVGDSTALSLTKCWRTLLTLDLSWCHNLKDEAFGLIVDSCSSLRLLKLFGCKQITNRFLHGHSNAHVQIIGLNGPSKVLGHLDLIKPQQTPLRYSPVTIVPDSLSLETPSYLMFSDS